MAPRMLLVDDDPVAVTVLADILHRHLAVTVDRFTDPREALLSLRANSYAVVLTDYHMPELNGMALLQAAREGGSEAVFILVSGDATPLMMNDGLRLGMFYVLPKPLHMLTTVTVVHQALASYELREEVRALRRTIAETGADLGAVIQSLVHIDDDESQG